MPRLSDHRYRAAIQMTLKAQAGGASTPVAITQATLRQGRELTARLAPILGPRGVEALFQRSLQLTRPAFPWLSSGAPMDEADPLAGLGPALEAREGDAALEASLALMLNFTDLLTSLIGASLTARLLGPVWNLPETAPEPETGHERR
jgi:hypothetical protein